MAAFYLVPGVYPREIDLSERVQAIATSVGAAVFASRRGPMKTTFISGKDQFQDLFGKPDPSWSYGHHSCLAFLTTGRQLWVQRVVKDAKHAGVVVTNDLEGSSAVNTSFTQFPSGRGGDYNTGGFQYQHLVFSAVLVSLNEVAVAITDGTNPITFSATYATSSDATMQVLADAITNQINAAYATGFTAAKKSLGKATVLKNSSSATDDRIIRITSPEGVNLTISSVTVTLGGSQATVSIQDSPALFDVYAENPGAWANDIGIQIRNLDIGVKQRRKLTFSALPVANQAFQAGLDLQGTRVQVGPVAYNTSGAQTMADIRAAFITAMGATSDAFLQANNLELVLVAPVDGPDIFDLIDPQIINTAGSATIPTVTNTQTLTGIAKEDTFEIWVYERTNQLVPLEKHVVSINKQVDGFGRQQFIEEVINNSATRSSLIRVVYNLNNPAGILATLPTSSTAGATPITWLAGGNDGVVPLNSQIMTGWNAFADRTKNAVRILIGCGYDDVAVQTKMVSIAENRYDCFAILDMPAAQQGAADAYSHRRNTLNLNTTYAAIYTPDLQIRDEFTNLTMYVPPSGYVASTFAYNDTVAAEWFAPAGLNRGLMKNIIGLRKEYTEGELQLISPNQINPIIKKPGKGYVIWGADTLQSKASALSNISVRRLLITIEVSLVDALDYTVYEPHDPYTQFQVVRLCENFLQPIKEARGLRRFEVISDDNNNKPYHRDSGQLNVDLILEPTLPVKYVRLTSVITKQGAAFSEIVGLLNGE